MWDASSAGRRIRIMADRWSSVRQHHDGPSPSPTVSRLLVLGFVVAVLLGLATGVLWVGWNLVRP